MKRRAAHRAVKLLGIVPRHQGSHDSLCAYYAAATLLCSLEPQFEDAFAAEDLHVDPLFSGVRRRRGETLERLVASWLASGMELRRVTGALNRACGKVGTTAFRHRLIPRSRAGFDEFCSKIDQGLPSLLAWEGREIGNHSVVVVGYERHARSKSRWLRVIDPIQLQEILEWGQLEELARAPLEIVVCTRHDGRRPDKLTTFRDGRQKLLVGRTRYERYDPRRQCYELNRE